MGLMHLEHNGGPWKLVAIALITIVVSSFGTWASLGSNKVSREEVEALIHSQTPSVTDFKALREDITGLKIEQARTTERLDLLLKKLP